MWIFLMPFFVMAGTPGLLVLHGDRKGKSLNNRLLFAVLVMQFVSTIVFKSHLSVFRNF